MSVVKVIPLGGSGEIGKNCTVVEQGDDLIVVDVGLSFPHEEHYGVDIVIPDFRYIVENSRRLKGIFLTHAHEDHVGALTFLIPKISCPIYCTSFTAAMVRSKLEERHQTKVADIRLVEPGDTVEIGELSVEFVRVTHSIPETSALAVRTEHGIVFFTADFKFDFTPIDGRVTNLQRLAQLGEEGVVLLVSDSTNVDRAGWSPSEKIVGEGLRHVIDDAPGRVFITMFASNVHRMQQVFDIAHETGRKVASTGRRMETTIELCRSMGYLAVREGTYIKSEDMSKFAPNELLILTTGSQGEPMAALSQMSRHEYSRIKITTGDTVIYSARPIPGNEGVIWKTINRLIKMGANVVHESPHPIHASGHAYREEIKLMVQILKPFYIAPVHGEARHQKIYQKLAQELGYPEHRVFILENGNVLSIADESANIEQEKVPFGEQLIDQHGNAPVDEVTLKERTSLAHDGVVVVQMAIDSKNKEVVSAPVFQARGFTGPGDTFDVAYDFLKQLFDKLLPHELTDFDRLAELIEESVKRTINKECRQRPEVIVALVEV